jgi:hypothetical protein
MIRRLLIVKVVNIHEVARQDYIRNDCASKVLNDLKVDSEVPCTKRGKAGNARWRSILRCYRPHDGVGVSTIPTFEMSPITEHAHASVAEKAYATTIECIIRRAIIFLKPSLHVLRKRVYFHRGRARDYTGHINDPTRRLLCAQGLCFG